MIYAVFLSSLGTIAGMVAFLFWQARRAASAADNELSSTRTAGDLKLRIEAQGRAIEDRDKAIETLTAERTRLEKTLTEVTKQRDELVAKIGTPNAAIDAIHSSLDGMSVPKTPATKSTAPASRR